MLEQLFNGEFIDCSIQCWVNQWLVKKANRWFKGNWINSIYVLKQPSIFHLADISLCSDSNSVEFKTNTRVWLCKFLTSFIDRDDNIADQTSSTFSVHSIASSCVLTETDSHFSALCLKAWSILERHCIVWKYVIKEFLLSPASVSVVVAPLLSSCSRMSYHCKIFHLIKSLAA